MKTLNIILKALAVVSIEAIAFANLFLVVWFDGGSSFDSTEKLFVLVVLSLFPTIIILRSVFRPCRIIFGSFFAYFSAIFVLLPMGISAKMIEHSFKGYYEIREWVLLSIFIISIYLVKKYEKTKCDEESKGKEYFEKRRKVEDN